jgi:peptidoglycan/LPS O-acetylase OafA/YrhL
MKNQEIERLRACAVLLVVMQHSGKFKDAVLHEMLRQGGPGVDLFFVISGYVVTASFLKLLPSFAETSTWIERIDRSRTALYAFFMRRLHRIGPMMLLWALIPLMLAKYYNTSNAFGSFTGVLKEVFAILTLQYNYAFAYGNGGQLSYYWSLAVEEHFYLLLPFLLIIFDKPTKRFGIVLFGIALVVFFTRPYLTFDGPGEWGFAYRGFVSHRKFDALFAGVLLYLVRQRGWLASFGKMNRITAWMITLFCLISIMAIQGILPDKQFWNGGQVVLWALAAILVMVASFERNWVLGLPGLSQLLEWVGARSYGIYLIHVTLSRTLDELYHHTGYNGPPIFREWYDHPKRWFLMVLVLTFALAELCYRLVEKPLIARGMRLTKPAAVTHTDAPATETTPQVAPSI